MVGDRTGAHDGLDGRSGYDIRFRGAIEKGAIQFVGGEKRIFCCEVLGVKAGIGSERQDFAGIDFDDHGRAVLVVACFDFAGFGICVNAGFYEFIFDVLLEEDIDGEGDVFAGDGVDLIDDGFGSGCVVDLGDMVDLSTGAREAFLRTFHFDAGAAGLIVGPVFAEFAEGGDAIGCEQIRGPILGGGIGPILLELDYQRIWRRN